jgi:hypothetical protein
MSKHKITVVVCLVLVAATGALSVISYNHYRTWRDEQTAKSVAASQAEAKANTLEKAIYNSNLLKPDNQCQKDHAAWSALPAAQQAKTPAPNCTLVPVQ